MKIQTRSQIQWSVERTNRDIEGIFVSNKFVSYTI